MSALVLLPIILVIAGLIARQWYVWARRDERSIQAHRSTLNHLEHVATEVDPLVPHREPAPHVRIIGGHPEPAEAGPPEAGPPEPAEEADRPAERAPRPERRRRRLVFVDGTVNAPEGPRAESPEVPAAMASGATPAGPVSGWAVPARTGPRSRVRTRAPAMGAAAAGLIVVAGAVTLAVHGGAGSGTHHAAASVTHPSQPPATRPAPASTVPSPIVTAVSSGASQAIYTASGPTVELNLAVTTNPCWVELRSSSVHGPTLFQGILQPGASQTFRAVGGLWLRLGNPTGVAVHLDGQPLTLPAAPNPFNVSVTTGA